MAESPAGWIAKRRLPALASGATVTLPSTVPAATTEPLRSGMWVVARAWLARSAAFAATAARASGLSGCAYRRARPIPAGTPAAATGVIVTLPLLAEDAELEGFGALTLSVCGWLPALAGAFGAGAVLAAAATAVLDAAAGVFGVV